MLLLPMFRGGIGSPAAVGSGARRRVLPLRARAFLAAEGVLVAICCLYASLWLVSARSAVRADTWLSLLAGREITRHGLPHHDGLAIVSHGRGWIDQQWLSHLGFYGLEQLGGIRLLFLVLVLAVVAPVAVAFAVARRRGASPASVAAFGVLPAVFSFPFLRAELVVAVAFVALLALLAAESRRPSRRILAAFPLLVLWANLHGSVVLAAGLVALLGAVELARSLRTGTARDRLRGLALLAAPWPCIFASPYGLSLAHYYAQTLGNADFRAYLDEWQPPTFTSPIGACFFVLVGAVIALVAVHRRALTAFERAALLVTLAGALAAVRSAVWFLYACVVLLPPVLDAALPALRRTSSRLGGVLAAAAAALALAGLAVAASRADEEIGRQWPEAAATAVARVTRDDPHARVWADGEYADWLLYRDRSLRGRIAFDGRWEILSREQLHIVFASLWQVGADWERPLHGYRLLVLDPNAEPRLAGTYARRAGVRVLYRDAHLVVYDRGA